MCCVMLVDDREKIWLQKAKQTSQKINLGWWIDCLRLPVVILALLLAVAVLRTRQLHENPDWNILLITGGGLIALVMLGCWLFARKSFESPEQSLVRLESHMKLNNSLSSAKAGISSWPSVPEEVLTGVEWRRFSALIPVLAAFFILLAAAYVPVGAIGDESYQQAPPKAFLDLAESIEELELQEVVDEEYIEQVEKQLQQLEEANSEDWFDHASLEAIDSLREAHQNKAAELEQQLRSSENSLRSLQNQGEQMSAEARLRQISNYEGALNAMNQGGMKLNKELLDRLKKLDPNSLNGMTQEQLDELRQRMREHAQCLNNQKGDGIGDGPGEIGDGEGSGYGNGGIDRGPGHAPGVLGGEVDPLATGDLEGIDPKTLGGGIPGDLLETTGIEHDVDESQTLIQRGGALGSKAEGGERVWQNELLPKEQKALKKFFK